ncbi:glycoside hydrolase family 3 N-terminal domain-containing protein [Lacrimispora sp.]|uniref:glycoside hydrolase family 3 protein n=1 Tax=Lacrimispora sp. TaxID=2719234 RepID=UPI0032E3FE5C
MVNLKEKPFCLNEEQIAWVKQTYSEMTLDEKIGQLFILLKAAPGVNEEQIKNTLSQSHQGGLRWQGGDKEAVYLQNTLYQKHSKIPLLIAANCDEGGNGCIPEGTFVATAAECGAGSGTEHAYHTGLTAGREATAVGCNWMFNPITDIYMNWRNTIVNTRSYGDNVQVVTDNARAYIKGIKEANPNMACCCKHFPGDGVEELDQHLALGVNSLSVEEWNQSFRKVYQTMIDEGLESIMAGHIALPEMSRKLCPGIKDEEIMPATLAPELITDLLRNEMKFNGVITTDASHMVGMTAMIKRCDAIPKAIASGCDMFLFANNVEEDMQFLREGIKNGIVTEERLSDAVHRVLALKAKLHLYDESLRIPDPALKDRWIGCPEHHDFTKKAADECITLVKDTKQLIPVDVSSKKRAYLVYVQSTPTSKAYKGDPVKETVIRELERAGFDVDVCPNYHDLEVENGISPMNFVKMLGHESRQSFIDNHDIVFLVINVKGYAQENNVRIRWSCNHSCELPWYNLEVPTIGISLNYTNHLIDVPQLHTFVNAYGSNQENIRAAIDKICGKSKFNGTANESVFCGRWDTRL